jgi:hypothetical protein
VLQKWGNDKVSPKEKVSASAIAGSIAGTAGGLLREFSICHKFYQVKTWL